MLSVVEKLLFLLLTLFAFGAAYQSLGEVYRIIHRGQGALRWNDFPRRLRRALGVYLTQRATLKTRRISGLFHLGIVLGFTFYLLVNLLDLLIGYIPNFEATLARLGIVYEVYRLLADILSVVVLVGVAYFVLRRFYLPNRRELLYHENILLHPGARAGSINRDSLIVAGFILIHVGARFLGESVAVAAQAPDRWSPFATFVSFLWGGLDAGGLAFMRHMMWWLALGGIVVFAPYFARSKHAHLFMAPLNFLTRPDRRSMGELEPLNFADESIEQFGADKIEDLSKTQILDAFACIMCNRCQDVCPAYVTGKELSPAAMEVNKRYYIRDHMSELANGEASSWSLMGSVISESAVWGCTSCGACIDVCPVGNEPMFDILDIRRDAVLMRSEFPTQLQGAFNGMERQGNPWQVAESRMKWAEGLDAPTVADNPDFDILYWAGCAVSYDPRAQQTARALVKILKVAGANFAVLGEEERCTGDVARRAGNEYLYFAMASANVETLNAVKPKRIVVTCPHCLHNLGKEYHQFGGNYEVVHHTQLIEEFIQEGKLPRNAHPRTWGNVTFHDPCYLGRHNDVIDAPRNALNAYLPDDALIEMPRNKRNSFCCGAGGAQFWKEEEEGDKAVNLERYEEAIKKGANVLAVGCPFCMQMFETARSEMPGGPKVKDVAELVVESLPNVVARPEE